MLTSPAIVILPTILAGGHYSGITMGHNEATMPCEAMRHTVWALGQDEPTDPQRAILVMIWAMVVYSIDGGKAKNHPGEPGWLNVPEH